MDIYFPKFKLDQKYQMDQLLQDLGIIDLFTNKADLSHLTDQRNIKISQVTIIACLIPSNLFKLFLPHVAYCIHNRDQMYQYIPVGWAQLGY